MNLIKTLEQKYMEPKGKKDCELVIYGNAPILLSAPHCVNQKREGSIKLREYNTGAIAEYLAQAVGCSVITKRSYNEEAFNDDANTDDESCEYKQKIMKYMEDHKIILFVDIHGLDKKKDSIIDIGLDGGKNACGKNYPYYLQRMIDRRFPEGKATIDEYYKASGPNILSKWMSNKYSVCSVQLEINGSYRWFEAQYDPQSIRLLNTLLEWLNKCLDE